MRKHPNGFDSWLSFYVKIATTISTKNINPDKFSFVVENDIPPCASNEKKQLPTFSTYQYTIEEIKENTMKYVFSYMGENAETIFWLLDSFETYNAWERNEIEKLKDYFLNFIL